MLKRCGVARKCFMGQPLCYPAALSNPSLHRGAPQGFFWHIPVLLPELLLVFSRDTFSVGEVLFILSCEDTYEKHVYCTSGLLTHCFLSGRNCGAQQTTFTQCILCQVATRLNLLLPRIELLGKKLF